MAKDKKQTKSEKPAKTPASSVQKKDDKAERKILALALEPRTRGLAYLYKDADPVKLWQNLGICCDAMQRLRRGSDKLAPVIGKMLLVAKNNPDLYTSRGHTTFEGYLKEVDERFGFSRTDAYDCIKIVEKMPSLTPEQYAKIPKSNLKLLARITDETKSDFPKLLARAESKPSEFREWAADKSYIEAGEATGSSIKIPTSKKVEREWSKFIAKSEVQAYCGTKDPGEILLKLIEECSIEWLAQGSEMEKQEAEQATA